MGVSRGSISSPIRGEEIEWDSRSQVVVVVQLGKSNHDRACPRLLSGQAGSLESIPGGNTITGAFVAAIALGQNGHDQPSERFNSKYNLSLL